jgi:beta-glucosidase
VGGDVGVQQGQRIVVRGESLSADRDTAEAPGLPWIRHLRLGRTYSTAATINADMDLEMPGGEPMRLWVARPQTQRDGNGSGWLTADKVTAAVSAGQMTQGVVAESVRRILRVMFTAGLFDHPHTGGGEVDTLAQRQVARTAANESIVLLKNSRLLPLNAERVRKIAVIGPNAAIARTGGGGSSLVRSKYAVTPLDGIKEAAGARADVAYALGAAMEGEEADKSPEELRAEAVARPAFPMSP